MLLPHPDLLYSPSCAQIQHLHDQADHERLLDQLRQAKPPTDHLASPLARALAILRAAWPRLRYGSAAY